MTPTDPVCPRCGGPNDVLHTVGECEALASQLQMPEAERYNVAVAASIIQLSSSPIEAAIRLYSHGMLRPPR